MIGETEELIELIGLETPLDRGMNPFTTLEAAGIRVRGLATYPDKHTRRSCVDWLGVLRCAHSPL